MGIFDFWKKKEPETPDLSLDVTTPNMNDNLGMGQNFGAQQDTGANSLGSMNLSTMGNPTYAQYPNQQGGTVEKDLQILSLKLDAIKSELDNISQRVKNIEGIAEKEQQQGQQKQRWY
jgi:hypothetical protein